MQLALGSAWTHSSVAFVACATHRAKRARRVRYTSVRVALFVRVAESVPRLASFAEPFRTFLPPPENGGIP